MAKRPASRIMPVLVSISPRLLAPEYAKVPIDKDKFVVGRSLTCCFGIPDVTISRRHCFFRRINDDWTVTDESTTGVFINEERVEKGVPTVVKDGDEIKFGFNLRWHYIFSLSEDYDGQTLEVPHWKKAKTLSEGIVRGQTTVDDDEKDVESAASETDVAVASGLSLEYSELKSLTQEDRGDKQNGLDDMQKEDESTLKEQEELKEQLRHAQKLTENINNERKMVLSALEERDQQLQNLKKNTHMEKSALRKKLKELLARLAEKEKQEEEDKRRLEEETKRVQILEEEKKKQEEYNKMLVDQLLQDIEKREKAAKLRLQEALTDLHKDRIAIESEIKEKSEAKEDVGKLLGELDTVKQNLMIVEQKREMLEKELTEAKDKVSVCTIQAREEIINNLGVLMETELQCSICNELFWIATTLTCDHTFCKFCISEWKKKKKECPICRRKISSEYRSLPLDNFISKMIENLSDEMKDKRKQLIAEREAIEKKVPKVKKERKRRSRYTNIASNQRQLWRFATPAAPVPGSIESTLNELMAQAMSASAASTSRATAPATSTSTAAASTSTVAASTSTAATFTSTAATFTSTAATFTSTAATFTSTAATFTSTAATSTSTAATSTSTAVASTSTAAASVPSTSTAAASTSVMSPAMDATATTRGGEAAPAPAAPLPAHSPTRSVSPPLADYVIVDLSNSSISSGDSPGSSDYSSDSSFAEGVPGSYYGGYGNCYHCGRSGHWANGCPDMY